jgi:hypothetical protein
VCCEKREGDRRLVSLCSSLLRRDDRVHDKVPALGLSGFYGTSESKRAMSDWYAMSSRGRRAHVPCLDGG